MAEGVEWTDGGVALRWRGEWPSTSTWDGGVEAVLAVHAADGATVLRWLASDPANPANPPGPPRQTAPGRPSATARPAAPGRPLHTTRPAAPGRPAATRSGVGATAGAAAVGGLWLSAAGVDGRCVKCGQVWPCLSCGP